MSNIIICLHHNLRSNSAAAAVAAAAEAAYQAKRAARFRNWRGQFAITLFLFLLVKAIRFAVVHILRGASLCVLWGALIQPIVHVIKFEADHKCTGCVPFAVVCVLAAFLILFNPHIIMMLFSFYR